VSACTAVAYRSADDEVVHAAELLIIRGKEQGPRTAAGEDACWILADAHIGGCSAPVGAWQRC
jgi:hypothetical protein